MWLIGMVFLVLIAFAAGVVVGAVFESERGGRTS